jgi:hypothetical protein
VAFAHERGEMLEEQRGQQRCDVQAVGVGVGEDDDLAVAQAGKIVLAGSQPIATARSWTSCDESTCPDSTSHVFKSFRAAAGSLEILVARLSRTAAGRVAFDEEEFRARQVARCAIGELAGQGGALRDLLADDLLLGLEAQRRALDRELRDPFADLDVLVEIQRKAVVHGVLDEAGRVARGQAFLGLAGKLRIAHLQRQHEAQPIPHVFRRELDAARQQVAELAELAQRIGQPERRPLTCVPPCAVGIRLT